MLRRIREMTRVSRVVTAGLDRDDPRLCHYFEKLPGTDRRAECCLAQVMLVSIPLDCSHVDAFASQLLDAYTRMLQEGLKINDLNGMGLVVERQDAREEAEPLMVQLERLPCSIEGKWHILRALTEFESHLKELTELIRPVAVRLQTEMSALQAMSAEPFARWEAYFQDHTVDDFQNEMFNTTFLLQRMTCPMKSGWGSGISIPSALGPSGRLHRIKWFGWPTWGQTSASALPFTRRSARMRKRWGECSVPWGQGQAGDPPTLCRASLLRGKAGGGDERQLRYRLPELVRTV
ncbi:MAG: hypothetical protein ACLU9S_13585 [Oscillospiraceae bacterium]